MAHFIHSLLILLLLASCGPNREMADKKITSACITAVKEVYDDSTIVIEVRDAKYIDDKTFDGAKLRTVKITANYTRDRGAIEEKKYTCSFTEISGFFGYVPRFYHMEMDGTRYGNFDGVIEGDLMVMMKINRAMVAALQ